MAPEDTPLPLCHSDRSLLLIIDLQERLLSAMPEQERDDLVANTGRLLDAARLLQVPILGTEQYPRGLGPTVAALAPQLPGGFSPMEKTSFSCCRASGFEQAVRRQRRNQILIAGMETHVCVLQTAAGLLQWDFQVFVAADAVCSRRPENTDNALRRMARAGVHVSNTESILFEWLGDASHAQFKAVSGLLR